MTIHLPPASEWNTDQVIALDWYDGPRSGVCRFNNPALEASFELLDERATIDDLDDRLYYLQELPTGSVQELAEAVSAQCGTPRTPIWVPIWPTELEAGKALAESVSRILKRGRDMDVILLSRDFGRILRIWTGQPRLPGVDWFARLSL